MLCRHSCWVSKFHLLIAQRWIGTKGLIRQNEIKWTNRIRPIVTQMFHFLKSYLFSRFCDKVHKRERKSNHVLWIVRLFACTGTLNYTFFIIDIWARPDQIQPNPSRPMSNYVWSTFKWVSSFILLYSHNYIHEGIRSQKGQPGADLEDEDWNAELNEMQSKNTCNFPLKMSK